MFILFPVFCCYRWKWLKLEKVGSTFSSFDASSGATKYKKTYYGLLFFKTFH